MYYFLLFSLELLFQSRVYCRYTSLFFLLSYCFSPEFISEPTEENAEFFHDTIEGTNRSGEGGGGGRYVTHDLSCYWEGERE